MFDSVNRLHVAMFDNCMTRGTALGRLLHLSGGYHMPIHHHISPEITANLSVGSMDGAILAVGEHDHHERHLIRELRKQLGHRPVLAYALNSTAHESFRDLVGPGEQGFQECPLDACVGPVADFNVLVQLLHQHLMGARSGIARDCDSLAVHHVGAELSPREIQILGLLGKGQPYKTVAMALGISLSTVYTYAKRIRFKYRLKGNAKLLFFAAQACIPQQISNKRVVNFMS